MKATVIYFERVNGELETISQEYEGDTKKAIEHAAKIIAEKSGYRLVEIRY